MISKKVQDAFNKHLNEEIYSSYLYLSMAAYCEGLNLPGFAQWLKSQAQEEWVHAMKFYDHIIGREGTIELFAVKEPKKKWESPLTVFKDGLEHEKYITQCINNLMDLAIEEKDHASRSFLNWFVDEQVEEEATFTEVVDNLNRIGGHEHLLLLVDREMAQRPGAQEDGQ